MPGEQVPSHEVPRFARERAEHVYELIQEAENECYRLAQALDWLSEDPEARKLRTKGRRLHKRLFNLLEPAENLHHGVEETV